MAWDMAGLTSATTIFNTALFSLASASGEIETPSLMRAEAISWAVLMGMAKPRPSWLSPELLALTMPMSSPWLLNRPPPELPGLAAALV